MFSERRYRFILDSFNQSITINSSTASQVPVHDLRMILFTSTVKIALSHSIILSFSAFLGRTIMKGRSNNGLPWIESTYSSFQIRYFYKFSIKAMNLLIVKFNFKSENFGDLEVVEIY